MAVNISDQNGRALEYAIVKHLKTQYDVTLTEQALDSQVRDKPKFDDLPPKLKTLYVQSSPKIGNWIKEKKAIDYDTTLDRPTDEEAKRGDVTDIRLTFKDESFMNLSIKHNHDAAKHQRPGALPQQCGFSKKSDIDFEYREAYKKIGEAFLRTAHELDPEAIHFEQLKLIDQEFININLYDPICRLTESFLNSICGDQEAVSHFFTFIVGTIDYYKVIVWEDRIEVLPYAGIGNPTFLFAEKRSDNYVKVLFSNGWELEMRLHSASKDITGI